MSNRAVVVVALLGLVGCLDGAEKGPEEEVPADGKLDSFARPTHHGEIAFGAAPAPEATLTATEKHHTWTFSLTGSARVHLYTGPTLTSRMTVDTVLYLYKQKTNGTWGAYVARNDDDGDSLWSSLTRNLEAGNYRVLVKGYAASTRGPFSIHVDCDGPGCAAPATCFFGTTFHELLSQPGLAVTGDHRLYVTDVPNLSALDRQRIVIAVQQSSHTDVRTVEEAFGRVDQGEVRRVDLYDEAGARAFVAFEYGAGDNSYGAVFGYGSTAVLSSIHDGDLENCATFAQTCALGNDWYQTRNGGAFTIKGTRVVTSAAELSGVDATNALAAIRVAYADATSLADGLARVDERRLNVVDLIHTATDARVTAYEYGAGDSSYGAIYRTGTTEKLTSIVDLTYYDCTFAE